MHRTLPLARVSGIADLPQGLTAGEAAARLATYGANDIPETPRGRWRHLIADTARDPMIWFLIATCALFAGLGEYAEAAVLLAASVPLIGMDLYLHRRTQVSTVALGSRLATAAKVLRDGHLLPIPSRDIVPGDVAVVASGEAFPADGLVIGGDELQADESALTGEAFPVRKRALAQLPLIDGEVPIAGEHWGAAGTRLLTGEARFLVVYTGSETLYGEIVRSARSGVESRTPLQQAIGALVAVLLAVAAVICLALAWVRLRQGFGPVDALLSAVTLAVAAIPEEFPVVFTVFLGVGVYRLARRQALVRRAVVVENIGRISCICTDKTGTLTEGLLSLRHRYPAAEVEAGRLVELAGIASRSDSGDPLDAALLAAAPGAPRSARVASYPFTEDRRRETAVVELAPGRLLAVTKGAPETIIAMCEMGEPDRKVWRKNVDDLAAAGHKTIACAYREIDAAIWPGGEPDRGYTYAGLLAFEDALRDGVAEAVHAARTAGIRVIMVTGDHPLTAAAVARELGLGAGAPAVVEAETLVVALARGEIGSLSGVDVVARAVPSQKLLLVRALQQAGEIVAVTGDGVNDVPALQAADVGIAMGGRGTRSAREIASIVLLDDNFRTIVRAIAEGQQLFRNLQLSFAYLMMIHFPLVLTAALIPLAGFPLLYLPVHVVWLELIIHPTAMLVFQELPSPGNLHALHRRRQARFFGPLSLLLLVLASAVITVAILWGYDYSLGLGRDVPHARAMALVTLTVASAALTAGLSMLRSWIAMIMVAATVGTTLLFVQWPPLAQLLHLAPLHRDDWLLAGAAGVAPALLSVLLRPQLDK